MVHSLQVSAPHCSLASASGSSWRAFSGHHHIPSMMKGVMSLYRPSAAGLFYKHFLFIYSFIDWVILLRERSPPTTCHLSCVMCQVSRARCNMSGVMSKVSHNMSHFFLFLQSVGADWWRVCYQWGLPCLVLVFTAFILKYYLGSMEYYWLVRIHAGKTKHEEKNKGMHNPCIKRARGMHSQ